MRNVAHARKKTPPTDRCARARQRAVRGALQDLERVGNRLGKLARLTRNEPLHNAASIALTALRAFDRGEDRVLCLASDVLDDTNRARLVREGFLSAANR